MSDSVFMCRMDKLSYVLAAAVKVAGKDDLAYVRLHRVASDVLAVSALGERASFRAKLQVDFIQWDDDRDKFVEITKHAAASLAGFSIKMPKDLDVEPLVSVTIGEESISVKDESGLFQTSAGRVEHRMVDQVLPGDHEKIFADARQEKTAAFFILPEQITLIAAVAKTLRRGVDVLVRTEPEETFSRWYVEGRGWEMTLSLTEKLATQNQAPTDPTPPEQDQEEEPAPARGSRLVVAAPAGGIA